MMNKRHKHINDLEDHYNIHYLRTFVRESKCQKVLKGLNMTKILSHLMLGLSCILLNDIMPPTDLNNINGS